MLNWAPGMKILIVENREKLAVKSFIEKSIQIYSILSRIVVFHFCKELSRYVDGANTQTALPIFSEVLLFNLILIFSETWSSQSFMKCFSSTAWQPIYCKFKAVCIYNLKLPGCNLKDKTYIITQWQKFL